MVRPLEDRDARRFADLAAQLGYPVDPEVARTRLAAVAGQKDQAYLVWDEPGMGVLGWVGCRIGSVAYLEPYGDLTGLVVDASARGRGVGQALLKAAEGWFRARGLAEVKIRSGGQRLEAHRFYEREGYGRLKAQVVFHKPLSPTGS